MLSFPNTTLVNCESLLVGEEYYAQRNDLQHPAHIHGVFSGYWFNFNGYKMVHFHNSIYVDNHGSRSYGEFEAYDKGLYLRLHFNQFEHWHFFRVRKLSSQDKKLIKQRSVDWQSRCYLRVMQCINLPFDIKQIIVKFYLVES